MKKENIELLLNSLSSIGVKSTDETIDKFSLYFDTLKYWSDKINITSLTIEEDVIIKHFVDSVIILKYINFNDEKIIDLGTGAGFPGLPIKIVCPLIEVTFIDSSHKKINCLKNICDVLKIKNYSIVCDNIEKLSRDPEHRGKYDFVTSRALASVSTIIEYGIPFLKLNGKLLIYKGPNVEKEVENSDKALKELGSKIVKNIDFELPFTNYKRKILVVEKTGITDHKYPRKVGIPKKRPL